MWHTWIDYGKFDQLIRRYYDSRSGASGQDFFTFASEDYMCITPEWALYKSPEKGFDPQDNRWRRKQLLQQQGDKAGGVAVADGEEDPYQATESGCG